MTPASRDTMETNGNKEALLAELERLRRENSKLRGRLDSNVHEPVLPHPNDVTKLPLVDAPLPKITNASPAKDKIALFRILFKAREDVYAVRWVSERIGKKGYSPACEDPWAHQKGKPKKYLPLTDVVVQSHLTGKETIGLFPLVKDNMCWFLAADFDKEGWQLDAVAYLEVCKRYRAPAYLERSRSGNGGHVWIFFSSPVSAVSARQLGMRLLRKTMDERADMDLGSYDRFFPNQDFMPRGGFGNLIAAPLQKKCRALGNSEFVDPASTDLPAWPDQWDFLSGVRRLSPEQLEALLEVVPAVGIGPVKLRSVPAALRTKHPAPAEIRCSFGSSFSVEKSGIPPWMLSKLKHLASLHNPQFYLHQKLRFSTHRIPRFIKCYREDFSHIHLPRGTFEEVGKIVRDADSKLVCKDRRETPPRLALKFQGSLRPEQKRAMVATLSHEMGVLVAPPGAGKTVMGCHAIATKNLPTLILAHRKPILEQWRKQLSSLLGLSSKQIGQIGGGRNRRSGVVDLAMIQSLVRLDDLGDFFSGYGFVLIDECHHLPASTFEVCMREASVRHILGLTATPYRRDGLHDIITMQCGPIRHRMEETRNDIIRRLTVRNTNFSLPVKEDTPIQEVFRALVHNEDRNVLLEADMANALSQGKRCLVLSHWKEHCRLLADKLTDRGITPFVLSGGQGKKERASILKAIQETPDDQPLVVVATGQYLGEGFDCPRLDTLFLTFPVAFKGKIVQYAGRILRDFKGKKVAEVFDYLDDQAPVLKRMHGRRLKVLKSMGFERDSVAGKQRSLAEIERPIVLKLSI